MPELRIDPLTGLRSIVAGERADRPGADFRVEPDAVLDPQTDPFLEGHEDETPPELWADRPGGGPPNSPGWLVRAVPNLYPALGLKDGEPSSGVVEPGAPPSHEDDPLASGRGEPDLFSARGAEGEHEVIVNTPGALSHLVDLGTDGVERAMSGWRERMRAHSEEACRHLIVNEGRPAGASRPHSHAQLYALPFVPAALARERERFTAHADRTHGRNLLEDVVQEEVRRGERIVAIDTEAVALSPFAARVPFQLMIVPRRPAARFEDEGPLGARLLHEVLARLRAVLGASPPLNLWVRTAPRGAESFCWRIDLLPRLTNPAGLELGTELALNELAPERAAERLRDAELDAA